MQLREKHLDARPLLEAARRACRVCHDHGVPFILNDRPDLAVEAEADGVHVGQDDAPPALARRLLGPDAIVGLSTHAPVELEAAATEPVDYVSAGPVSPTPTKPGRPGTGIAYLSLAATTSAHPFFVTGGVTPETVGPMLAAGARRFVVVRWLTEADEPRVAARAAPADRRRLRHRLRRVRPGAALTAEPAEQRRHRPGIVAQPVAGAAEEPQVDHALGRVGELPHVLDRHHAVVVTVHEEDRTRRHLAHERERPDLAELAGPRLRVVREIGIADHADLTRVGEEAVGVRGPVREVGRRRERGDPLHAVVLAGRADGERPALAEPGEPDAFDPVGREQGVDRRPDVGEPAAQREVAGGRARAAEVEREHGPAQLDGETVGELAVGLPRRWPRPGGRPGNRGTAPGPGARPPPGGRAR